MLEEKGREGSEGGGGLGGTFSPPAHTFITLKSLRA